MTAKNILVIDDELGYRALLESDLTFLCHLVFSADGGPSALKILESQSVDLLITDMRMSPMDGLEVVAAFKQKFPTVPVILMSGYAAEDRVEKVLQYKPSAFIKKPFDLTELHSLLSELTKE